MKHIVSIIGITAAAACGGSDFDPGSGDDPGSGTQTLLVEGRVSAEPRTINARASIDFDTEFSVSLSLDGAPVTTGTVTITNIDGAFDLVFQEIGDNAGRWTGRAPGYTEVYMLDVVSGADYIEGVRVDGPDIHVFTSPEPGAIVDSTQPLEVTWSSERADTAAIDPEELDWISIPDEGAYTLAAGTIKADADQARENTLRLRRTNRVIPAGAAPGSEWSVRIENEINVVAQATGL